VIVSSSSLNNSTSHGETLKQVIVASLTENVKKMDLIESDNKKNCSSKQSKASNTYLAEQMIIEQIEPFYTKSEDDESIDPSYAIDYIGDIMNLLYTLEKKISNSIIIFN